MASTDTQTLKRQDFVTDQDVRWCPGCGDYAILAQAQKVFPDLGIPKENILIPVVSPIIWILLASTLYMDVHLL